jgi:hypothetical protein
MIDIVKMYEDQNNLREEAPKAAPFYINGLGVIPRIEAIDLSLLAANPASICLPVSKPEPIEITGIYSLPNVPAPADRCLWALEDDDAGVWETECGGAFILIEGTPTENNMAFCPYCGKRLSEADLYHDDIPDP